MNGGSINKQLEYTSTEKYFDEFAQLVQIRNLYLRDHNV